MKYMAKRGRPRKIKSVDYEADHSLSFVKPILTFLGEGPLSGEYRFKEIAGSIAAESKEAAFEKANEIVIKHPSLLIK